MDYTVQAVDVLGAASDYGTPYNVKFAEEAETVFMLAKKAPVVGEVEHGNITDEPTKKDPSKTYKRFRRSQDKPGFTASTGNANLTMNNKPDHDSMYRCNALNNAVAWCSAVKQGDQGDVIMIANDFYTWLKSENKGYEAAKATAESLRPETEQVEEKTEEVFDGEEINLDDIPF